ncbi:MAG: hypothetical protein Kow00108_15200 [Calditrichia bacterium]
MTKWDAYMNQLQYLIDQKIFALEYQKLLDDQKNDIKQTLDFLTEKEMVKALYKNHVLNQIEITPDDYQTAYLRSKRKIQLEYIIGKNRQHLEEYRKIMMEKSVQDINLKDPSTEQKGITPMFSFGDMDETVESVAFGLKPFEVSNIFSIGDEYMVIKLVNGETNKFASEIELAFQKPSLKKVITDRKAKPLAVKYINKLMDGVNIHIDPQLFRQLSELIRNQIHGRSRQNPIENPVNNAELNNIAVSLEELFEAPLATYDGKKMTIKQFLDFYRIIPPQVRPSIHKPKLLRDAIVKFIEFQYLTDQAYDEELDKDPEVLRAADIQRKEYLAFHYLKSVKKSLVVDDPMIKEFRESEKMARFEKVLGRVPADEDIRTYIMNDLFANRVLELSDSLRKTYRVEIFENSMRKLIKDSSDTLVHDPIVLDYKERFF